MHAAADAGNAAADAGRTLRRKSGARLRPVAVPLAVAGLLAVHAGLLGWEATRLSPTVDEPGHLVAGLAMWRFGQFDVYKVNPPLPRLVAALPVHLAGYRPDWSLYVDEPRLRPEFLLGERLVAANGLRSIWLFTLARWACIPFSLLGGLVCFLWARALYGTAAGLASLLLWCCDPNVLAFGTLLTTDAAAAAFGLAASYAFWCWLRTPTPVRAALAGLLLGLAELSKMSWVILFVLWPLLWLFWRDTAPRPAVAAPSPEPQPAKPQPAKPQPGRPQPGRPPRLGGALQLAGLLLLGLVVLNCGYLCNGTLTPLGKYRFISQRFNGAEQPGQVGNRFVGTALAAIPVPLPRRYLEGLDSQTRDIESSARPNYLRGVWKRGDGWWYYYLYGLLVKVPHGTQILLLTAAALLVLRPRVGRRAGITLRDECLLLAPALALFVLTSSETEINRHFRYLLPAVAMLLVFCGRAAAALAGVAGQAALPHPNPRAMRPAVFLKPRLAVACLTALLPVLSAVESLRTVPHSLAFFNALCGGSRNGHRHLLGSNFDWGQDLLELRRWQAMHPREQLRQVIYGGRIEPAWLGIRYNPVPRSLPGEPPQEYLRRLPPGLYAVSAAFLSGYEGVMYDGRGHARDATAENTMAFAALEPAGHVGATLCLLRKRKDAQMPNDDSNPPGRSGQ